MSKKPQSVGDLNANFARAGAVTFETHLDGAVAVLSHAAARAVVALQGAQVISYETEDFGELLWLSPFAQLGTGKAVRGGIPICWPWFGPHPDGGTRPAHGLVRARPWHVAATAAHANGPSVTFSLSLDELTNSDWPHRAMVALHVHLGEALTVSLTTANTGEDLFTMTQALHTYLRVGDIDSVRVEGLEDVPFIDQLQPGELKREQSALHITCEIDRIYQDQFGPVTLIDSTSNKRLTIAKSGSASSVLWNPWIEKSARLGDMGEDGYRQMVCIETANAGADTITLAPNASHTLIAQIAARRR